MPHARKPKSRRRQDELPQAAAVAVGLPLGPPPAYTPGLRWRPPTSPPSIPPPRLPLDQCAGEEADEWNDWSAPQDTSFGRSSNAAYYDFLNTEVVAGSGQSSGLPLAGVWESKLLVHSTEAQLTDKFEGGDKETNDKAMQETLAGLDMNQLAAKDNVETPQKELEDDAAPQHMPKGPEECRVYYPGAGHCPTRSEGVYYPGAGHCPLRPQEEGQLQDKFAGGNKEKKDKTVQETLAWLDTNPSTEKDEFETTHKEPEAYNAPSGSGALYACPASHHMRKGHEEEGVYYPGAGHCPIRTEGVYYPGAGHCPFRPQEESGVYYPGAGHCPPRPEGVYYPGAGHCPFRPPASPADTSAQDALVVSATGAPGPWLPHYIFPASLSIQVAEVTIQLQLARATHLKRDDIDLDLRVAQFLNFRTAANFRAVLWTTFRLPHTVGQLLGRAYTGRNLAHHLVLLFTPLQRPVPYHDLDEQEALSKSGEECAPDIYDLDWSTVVP